MVITEPCETLTTPDGYTLTREGEQVVGCFLGGGLLLAADPSGNALAAAQALAGTAGLCGGSPPVQTPSTQTTPPPVQTPPTQTTPPPVQPQPSNIQISIAAGSSSPSNGQFFVPSKIGVVIGDTVTWTNDDTTLHTVTSGNAEAGNSGTEFDSSYLAAEKTFQHQFNTGGTFDYYCTLHPYMTGSVTVSQLVKVFTVI